MSCRNRPVPTLVLILSILALAPISLTGEEFTLRDGDTFVFFGDSITQAGHYIDYFESYLLTRFPERSFRVINHGKNSETISGTTEADHDPPRPWALPRFTRDITAWKPDVVVACFGMNDGNYHPFDSRRFEKYQQGVRQLIARTRDQTGARLVLLTPPPFDPYRRKVSDPDAVSFGYKFPAIDYDNTLARYSRWLVSLREIGPIVVDLHTRLNEHLARRRKEKVSFYLSGDAVHPNATGHWLMAQHLLLALNAPARVDSVDIDVSKLQTASDAVLAGSVSELKLQNAEISFSWTTRLPMPMDPSWDAESIELENVPKRLNDYRLKIRGLSAARYQLKANGREISLVTSTELAKGIDLLRLTDFPTVQLSHQVLKLVRERRRLAYRLWRDDIEHPIRGKVDSTTIASEKQRIEQIETELDDLRRLKKIHIRLVPVEE